MIAMLTFMVALYSFYLPYVFCDWGVSRLVSFKRLSQRILDVVIVVDVNPFGSQMKLTDCLRIMILNA